MTTKWTRYGECNGCGDCCRIVAREAIVRYPEKVTDPEFYRARGFSSIVLDGRPVLALLADLVAPCQHHSGASCAIYDARPKTCRDYPLVPLDIVGTRCSYWFERGNDRVGGNGSPYPSHPMTLALMEGR